MTAQSAPSTDLLVDMVQIPAGTFLMGSTPSETGHYSDEGPQHEVTLQAFLISRTPITQAQWREVAGWVEGPGECWGLDLSGKLEPSRFRGDNRPVETVNWFEAMEFCSRLSQRSGKTYTLPSEAQWEYACRAGISTPFHFGETITPELANFDSNETTPVGAYPANAWGLYDMHGNVWEWCLDDWHEDYNGAPTDGSAWQDKSLGKPFVAVPGSTTRCAAARPTATSTSPPMPSTTSASVCVADGGNSLEKPFAAVPGSTTRCAAARPTATSTPPLPTTSSASVCVADGGNSLGKPFAAVPGSTTRCTAARPPATSASTPPVPSTPSASVCVADGGNSLEKPFAAVPGSTTRCAAARPTATSTTPPMPSTASASVCVAEEKQPIRMLRGGSWFNDPVHCRSAFRDNDYPAFAHDDLGFRVCCPST